MNNLTFADDAWDEYLYWQTQDKKTLNKINSLLKEIRRTPFAGSGKPEPLKEDKTGKWSRRINEKDRLVYSIEDGVVIVFQCRGHYGDRT